MWTGFKSRKEPKVATNLTNFFRDIASITVDIWDQAS